MEGDELERIRARKYEALMKSIVWRDAEGMASEPILVSDMSFDNIVSEYQFLVLDCWATWCGPCKIIAPIIDDLASVYEGKIAFGKLNVDENPKTATRFYVMSIPTLLLFKEGKLADRIIGVIPRNDIEAILRKYL